MATATTTITNISNQVVPILIDSITSADAAANSTIPASRSQQLQISAGSKIVIETQRVSLGQLEQLRRMNVIIY